MAGREASLASLVLVLDFLLRFYWGYTGSFYGAEARMPPKAIELAELANWYIS